MTETNHRRNSAGAWVGLCLMGLLVIGGGAIYFFNSTEEEIATIGIARWAGNPEFDRSVHGFKEGLAENGYVEGKNVRFIIRNPETDLDRQREIIESFIRTGVDLIFSLTTPGTLVAKELTNQMKDPIPVVFSICTYPVESNLIATLKSSNNNLVGTRNYVPFSQQFYAFERISPHTQSLAVVRRKGEPNSTSQFKEVKALLGERGIRVVDIAAVDLEDIRRQLEANIETVDAVFSTCDTLTHSGGDDIIAEQCIRYKKPSFACNKEGVLKGNLIGDIGDFNAIGKISGEKAALILKGAKPAWLTSESPRGNYIILNQKTATAIGLDVPQELLDISKEIITE